MRTFIILSIFCHAHIVVIGQTDSMNQFDSNGNKDGKWTVFYNAAGKEVSDSAQAVWYRYTYYLQGKNLYAYEWCGKNDVVIALSGQDQNEKLKLLDGAWKITDKKGNVKSIQIFNKGEYVAHRVFYPTGNIREYCNFENQHFERGEFEPHTYCKRVYDQTGAVEYYYMRGPPSESLWSFYRSNFDSTYVTNQKVVGDSTFATVTHYSGNQTLRQMDQIIIKGQRSIAHGSFTFWYANGQKKEEGLYDHNKRIGEWKQWEKDGTEIKTAPDLDQLNRTDEDGKKTGWWIVYLDDDLKQLKDSTGATHCRYTYYTGRYDHYFMGTIGSKKAPVQFSESDTLKRGKLNLLNGDHISNYETGNVQYLLSARDGIITDYKEFYPEGELKTHLIYSMECGAPIRICIKQYDKNGNLTYDGTNLVPQDLRRYNSEN